MAFVFVISVFLLQMCDAVEGGTYKGRRIDACAGGSSWACNGRVVTVVVEMSCVVSWIVIAMPNSMLVAGLKMRLDIALH